MSLLALAIKLFLLQKKQTKRNSLKYVTAVKIAIIKKARNNKCWRKGNFYALLIEMKIGIATKENMKVSQKIKKQNYHII